MESCGGGNHSEQVSIDPWEVRERLRVHQSEDPWEVREQLFRGFRASQTYITGSESNVNGSKAEGRACLTLLHRLVVRVPKATLDILGAYAEDLFRAIFGLELDCGKLWRRKSLGTGVYQPEDPWEVRERLLVHQPEDLFRVARGPVGGERTASCVPARGPVGGERTAFSMLPRRFRDSRRLEALLKGRKRKMLPRRFRDSRRLEAKTGRARRCFTDFFYGFRKQR